MSEDKDMMDLNKEVSYMRGRMDEMANRIDKFYQLLHDHMEEEDKERDKLDKKIWGLFIMMAVMLTQVADWSSIAALLALL